MKLLAWLYLTAPMWMIRRLPDRINHSTGGPFNDALETVYNARVDRQYRRICRIPRMGWDTALAVRKNWLRERADITSGGWAPGAYGPSLQGGLYGHPDPHEGTAE